VKDPVQCLDRERDDESEAADGARLSDNDHECAGYEDDEAPGKDVSVYL
jgi:hypothetical protein